jgi:WD40 repeat protein
MKLLPQIYIGCLWLLASAGVAQQPEPTNEGEPVAAMLNPAAMEELATLGKTAFRHTAVLTSIRVRANNQEIVTTARDGTARLWDLETGVEKQRFAHLVTKGVWDAQLLDDQDRLLTCNTDGIVRLWDTVSGKLLREYDTTARAFRIAIFPDQKRMVSVGNSGAVAIWEIDSGERLQRFRPLEDDIYGVDIDPTGSKIVVCGESGVSVINADAGEAQFTFKPENDVYTARFSPNGQRIAICDSDGLVSVLQSDDGQVLFSVKHSESTKVVAWSPDGTRLAVSDTTTGVYLCDSKSGQQTDIFSIEGIDTCWATCFSLDGKRLFAGADCDVVAWDIASGEEFISRNFGLPAELSRLEHPLEALEKEIEIELELELELELEDAEVEAELRQFKKKQVQQRELKEEKPQQEKSQKEKRQKEKTGDIARQWSSARPPCSLQGLAFTRESQLLLADSSQKRLFHADLNLQQLTRDELVPRWQDKLIAASPDGRWIVLQELQPQELGKLLAAETVEFKTELEVDGKKEVDVEERRMMEMMRPDTPQNGIHLSVYATSKQKISTRLEWPAKELQSLHFVDRGRYCLLQSVGTLYAIETTNWQPHWRIKFPSSEYTAGFNETVPYFTLKHKENSFYLFDVAAKATFGLIANREQLGYKESQIYFLMHQQGALQIGTVGQTSDILLHPSRISARPTELSDAEFQQLIGQLDSPSFRERELAGKRLIEQGERISKMVEQVGVSSPEAQWRLREIEHQIARAIVPDFSSKTNSSADRKIATVAIHPDGKHFAFVLGDDANASIQIASIRSQGIEIVRSIDCRHGPHELKFSYDGTMLIANNQNETVTVFACR